MDQVSPSANKSQSLSQNIVKEKKSESKVPVKNMNKTPSKKERGAHRLQNSMAPTVAHSSENWLKLNS